MTDGLLDDDFADIEPEADPVVHTSRSARQPAGTRRQSTRVPKRVKDIQDALAKQMFTFGTMVGVGLPVTGYYMCAQSDEFTAAVMKLAAKDARYLDALENITTIMPVVTIGRTVLGLGVALGADRWLRSEGERGVDPARRIAMLLGVTEAYWEVTEHGDSDSGAPPPSSPPHAVFVPVT